MADGGERPLPPPRPPPPSAPLPSEARGAARRARAAAATDVGQEGGGTSRRVTRRGQPPPPPSPSALRETTGVTCAQCNHKKAKCASSAELEMMGRGVRMASRSPRPIQPQLSPSTHNAQHTLIHTPLKAIKWCPAPAAGGWSCPAAPTCARPGAGQGRGS